MKTVTQELIDELLELPRDERRLLVCRLADSLDEDDEEAVEQAWLLEAQRRVQEIESGAVECIPGEQVFSELRKRFG